MLCAFLDSVTFKAFAHLVSLTALSAVTGRDCSFGGQTLPAACHVSAGRRLECGS